MVKNLLSLDMSATAYRSIWPLMIDALKYLTSHKVLAETVWSLTECFRMFQRPVESDLTFYLGEFSIVVPTLVMKTADVHCPCTV